MFTLLWFFSFFYFIWKYIKEFFFLDCLKYFWPLWAPLALWFPHLFFSFIYLFWTNDAVVLFSLSTFAEQVSNILQFPSVYNFPLHMHTYFLIYTDDKILPNISVLKSCLILAAWNSDFFGSVYNDDNPIGSLWKPVSLLEKRMLMPERFIS